VSIDHHIHVAAGLRDGIKDGGTTRYPGPGFATTPHQVFLAQAAPFLIDEQFYFEDPLDARWFFNEGWKNWLYEYEDEQFVRCGCDRMALWIGGDLVDERGLTVFETPQPRGGGNCDAA
jgi:hypothetical protein